MALSQRDLDDFEDWVVIDEFSDLLLSLTLDARQLLEQAIVLFFSDRFHGLSRSKAPANQTRGALARSGCCFASLFLFLFDPFLLGGIYRPF